MTAGPFADQIDFLDPPLHQALPVKVDGSEQLRPKPGPVKVFLMRRLRHLTRGDDRTLTVRERDVMRLAAQGLTNKAIAQELNITEGTIKLCPRGTGKRKGFLSQPAEASSAFWWQSGEIDGRAH